MCVGGAFVACALQQDHLSPLVWSWHPFIYRRKGVSQRSLHLLVPGGDTSKKEMVLEAQTENHLGAVSLAKVLSCFGKPREGHECWGEVGSWAVEALFLTSLEERQLSGESGEECSAKCLRSCRLF